MTAEGPAPPGDDAAGRKNLLLLVQLRWIAVVGQVVTVAVVSAGLGVPLPIGAMAGVVLGLALLNAASLIRLSQPSPVDQAELALALALDVLALTAQLGLSGGVANPFAFLYLLQATLAAVLLDAGPAWCIAGGVALCAALLTAVSIPLDVSGLTAGELVPLEAAGRLVCLLLDAGLLVAFVAQVGRNLRERDAGLARLRQRAAEEDGIVRMGLLASGAAHLLGTPLATMSVILGDWRRVPALAADPELAEELATLEAEVRRCKSILTGILASAGEARGESAARTTLRRFLDGLVAEWRAAHPGAALDYSYALPDDPAVVSDTSLKQIVVNLLDNAAEASPDGLRLEAERDGGLLRLAVSDHGPGFAPEILRDLGAPYRSTKGRPGGGLGLFLVFNVVRKLGGRVTVGNPPGGGAVVSLALPLSALEPDPGPPRKPSQEPVSEPLSPTRRDPERLDAE